MTAPQIPLRLLYLDAVEHEDPATLCEIVSVYAEGLERVRKYDAATGECVVERRCRLRSNTVREWERLTGERLTPALEPVASEKRAR